MMTDGLGRSWLADTAGVIVPRACSIGEWGRALMTESAASIRRPSNFGKLPHRGVGKARQMASAYGLTQSRRTQHARAAAARGVLSSARLRRPLPAHVHLPCLSYAAVGSFRICSVA